MNTHNLTQQLRGPTGVGPKNVVIYQSIAGGSFPVETFVSAPLVKGDYKKSTPYYWRHSKWTRLELWSREIKSKGELGPKKPYVNPAFSAPPPPYELRQQAYNRAYFRLQSELTEGNMGWGISAIQHKMLTRSVGLRVRQAKEYLDLLKRDPSDEKIIDFLMRNRLIDRSGTLRATVQGRTKHVGYFASKSSGGWLEVSYGYLPILGDLQRLLNDVAAAQAAALVKKRKYTGTSKSYHQMIDTMNYRVTTQIKATAVIDVSVWTDLEDKAYKLNTAGFLNLPVIFADAVPYSFVVNWFTNHEAYLHALTAQVGRKMHGYIGEYQHSVRTVEPSDSNHKFFYQEYGGSCRNTYTVYDRAPVNGKVRGPSLDGWSFNDTPFKSLMRQLNAAALLIQRGAEWGQRRDEAFRDHRNAIHEARRNVGVKIEVGRYQRVIPGHLTLAEGRRYLDNIRDINSASLSVVRRR